MLQRQRGQGLSLPGWVRAGAAASLLLPPQCQKGPSSRAGWDGGFNLHRPSPSILHPAQRSAGCSTHTCSPSFLFPCLLPPELLAGSPVQAGVCGSHNCAGSSLLQLSPSHPRTWLSQSCRCWPQFWGFLCKGVCSLGRASHTIPKCRSTVQNVLWSSGDADPAWHPQPRWRSQGRTAPCTHPALPSPFLPSTLVFPWSYHPATLHRYGQYSRETNEESF